MFCRDQFTRLSTLCLLVLSAVTNTNSMDPYQARQIVGPDLDPNLFDTVILEVFLKESLEKVDFEKISR